jgi:hypothetical protein
MSAFVPLLGEKPTSVATNFMSTHPSNRSVPLAAQASQDTQPQDDIHSNVNRMRPQPGLRTLHFPSTFSIGIKSSAPKKLSKACRTDAHIPVSK